MRTDVVVITIIIIVITRPGNASWTRLHSSGRRYRVRFRHGGGPMPIAAADPNKSFREILIIA